MTSITKHYTPELVQSFSHFMKEIDLTKMNIAYQFRSFPFEISTKKLQNVMVEII